MPCVKAKDLFICLKFRDIGNHFNDILLAVLVK